MRTIELGSSKSKLNSSGGSDDLEILEEIPGKKRPNPNNLGNINNLSSLLGSGNNVTGGANPFFNSQTLLQAQDPYAAYMNSKAGSSAAANSMDILQKCKKKNFFKRVSSKPSGTPIVAPNLCFLN